jgi:hypothetical protein
VLRQGGVLAGYVIHTPPGLSEADLESAGDLGPSFVAGMDDPAASAALSGFDVLHVQDVTARFRETGLAWIEGLGDREALLREELGDVEHEYELERKGCIIEGIESGLLRRSYCVFKRR